MSKPPLIVIAGPTAVGKTALSIGLAKAIGGEIISCDSMQVYKYMDIGSAKISPQEMAGVPHYLVDELEPTEPFNVAVFLQRAKAAIAEIYSRGHIPIAVGGTGFYIQALIYDTDFTAEEGSSALRQQLEAEAESLGSQALHARLATVDPASAEAIHPNNAKRIIRALEYFELHGQPISEHNECERAKESPYNFALIVLNDDRAKLYQRIDARVDAMVSAGLVEEVEGLKARGYDRSLVSMQGIGYKELLAYLEGECSLEEAIYIIKRDTRHFAKRQLTWFRAKPEALWVQKDAMGYDDEAILNHVLTILRDKQIYEENDNV